MISTTKHIANGRHTGYSVSNDEGALLATVTQTKRRGAGYYFVRLYTGPETCEILTVDGILDARDIAEAHALRFA